MFDIVKFVVAFAVVIAAVFLYYNNEDLIAIGRVGIVLAGVLVALGLMLWTASGQRAWAFVKGANLERKKVVWPSRKETVQVTIMVIVLTFLVGLMIWLFDWMSSTVVYNWILG